MHEQLVVNLNKGSERLADRSPSGLSRPLARCRQQMRVLEQRLRAEIHRGWNLHSTPFRMQHPMEKDLVYRRMRALADHFELKAGYVGLPGWRLPTIHKGLELGARPVFWFERFGRRRAAEMNRRMRLRMDADCRFEALLYDGWRANLPISIFDLDFMGVVGPRQASSMMRLVAENMGRRAVVSMTSVRQPFVDRGRRLVETRWRAMGSELARCRLRVLDWMVIRYNRLQVDQLVVSTR